MKKKMENKKKIERKVKEKWQKIDKLDILLQHIFQLGKKNFTALNMKGAPLIADFFEEKIKKTFELKMVTLFKVTRKNTIIMKV